MILHAQNISSEYANFLGGKAKGLLWLQNQGFLVPDFFVIPVTSVESLLRKHLIKTDADFTASKLEEMKKEIIGWLGKHSFQGLYAVRSSALQEDSSEHSFAGIFSSCLNVQGAGPLADAVLTVMKSSYSQVAASYLKSRGLQGQTSKMCVILQKMVAPTFSGVSFGLDLQTGDRKTAWISATEGLGEKLVSGEVAGHEFIYKEGQLKSFSSSDSSIRMDILKKVGERTLELSEAVQHPMDIEWAFDGHDLYFLQARPVTTTVQEMNSQKTVFDNSNIQESYNGVTTPLTFTYASVAYFKVYTQLMKLMLLKPSEIEQARWSLENMLGLVSGRVYYNINNWYAGLLYMPSFGKRKKEMEDMMGLEKPVPFVTGFELSKMQKLKRFPHMVKLISTMIFHFGRMDALVKEFDEWFWKVYNEADVAGVPALSEVQIFEKIRFYQDRFLEKWSIPVLNDTKVMMDMGKVKRTLEKYNFQGELKSIIYGADVESVKPTLEIHKLSKMFAADPSLTNLLNKSFGHELLQGLEIWYPQVFRAVKDFIHLYGDRCIGELKLETITIRQDPEILFSMVRSYVTGGLHLKDKLFVSHGSEVDKMFAEVQRHMGFFEKIKFGKNVQQLKKSIAAREKMRLHRTRNFGLMRVLYLELGKRWAAKGMVAQARDIFYLTHSEIFEIGTGRSVTMSLKKLVDLRKADFEESLKLKVPTQVEISFPPGIKQNSLAPVQVSSELQKGLACSQGIIEGEVILVESPEQISQVNGKILLAERTDPGWTPLFALVKGVVIEKGSLLSHSAVIAREMSIPAVLNIPDVTKILRTGDWIQLDGNTGTVKILKRREIPRGPEEFHSPSL